MKRTKRKIEPATPGDVLQLAELLGELFALEPDFRPDRAKQLRGLRSIIKRPKTGCILVVREGKQILGMVNLLFTISTAEGGPAVLMEDLIVRAEHRGAGLGTKLMKHAIKFARAKGCTRITLLTSEHNAGAIRFYKRHGFKASTMVPMRLHLRAE
jgi:ribosomal protein S18 acetylase RimI-like enzyme